MKVEFSQHALDQPEVRRRITKPMIMEVLKNPDDVQHSYKDRELYRKQYDNEILEVVAVKEDNKLIVITEYFLEQ